MFRFAMHYEDAAGHVQKARNLGITTDDKFTHLRWERFCRRHPGYDVWDGSRPWDEADDEYEALSEEVDFRWRDASPATAQEAARLVAAVFFSPPVRVWIGGHEYDLTDLAFSAARGKGISSESRPASPVHS